MDDMTPKWGVEILVAIERLSAKIEANDERHTASGDWAMRNIKDHELRIRVLESFRWKLMGASAIFSVLASLIATVIVKVTNG